MNFHVLCWNYETVFFLIIFVSYLDVFSFIICHINEGNHIFFKMSVMLSLYQILQFGGRDEENVCLMTLLT